MSYYYKISDQEIKIYSDTSSFPVNVQVGYPNGMPFESLDDAKSWAESYISFIADASAPMPKNAPEDEEKFRLTREEILALIDQITQEESESR